MTITIIGSGKVGASGALNCGLRELDDVLLLDIVQGLPQGEAYGYKPSAIREGHRLLRPRKQ